MLGRAITLNSVWLVWYRLMITVASLWILYLLFNRVKKLPTRSVLSIGLIGTVQALHWVCFYASIKYANVTIALTCLATSALISSILEPLLLKKRYDPFEIVLGLFAIAGIWIIYQTHLQFSVGIVLGLLAALLTVIVSVLNKKMVDNYLPEHIAIYQLTGGLVGLSILLPVYLYLFPAPMQTPVPIDWLWLVLLSWVCTILTFFLYIHSLRRISAFTMNLTLTLEPIYGIILAFIIYKENENLSNWFYLGFGLIVLAVAFHMWHILRSPTTTEPIVPID